MSDHLSDHPHGHVDHGHVDHGCVDQGCVDHGPVPAWPDVPFATIPAAQLRVGDLIYRPGPGGSGSGHGSGAGRHVYLLVARAAIVDDLVQLHLYDSDSGHPHGRPATYHPADRVLLACRDLIEPDDRRSVWTDARWRRAYQHGTALALVDQLQARLVGRPAMVVAPGDSIEDEIDRIRGRDPQPARVLRAEEITALLATIPPERLDLDVAQPAVRAVLTLFGRVKAVEGADGSWNGGDVVGLLTTWLEELGIDPEAPITDLTGRVVTTARTHPHWKAVR